MTDARAADRIKHDVCYAASLCLCDALLGGVVYEEAAHIAYVAFSAAIDKYLALRERERRRLRGAGPSAE